MFDSTADPTEAIRRERRLELNEKTETRASLEKQYGKVWDTNELQADFIVIGFMAPYVVVKNKATGQKGSMEFTHMPRFYFNFVATDR